MGNVGLAWNILRRQAWYGGVFASGYFPTIGYMNTDAFVTGTTFLYRYA